MMHRILVAQGDGASAGWSKVAAFAPFIAAKHAYPQIGKIQNILRDNGIRLALKACKTVLDVVRKTNLAHLTVGNDVDANGNLVFDHIDDGVTHAVSEFDCINRLPLLSS